MTTVTANRFIRLLFTVLLCICLVLTAWAFTKAIMFGVISLMITAGIGYMTYRDYKNSTNPNQGE